MGKTILLLNDRFQFRYRLTNLGDRAMQSGLYRLVGDELGYDFLSGGCKNFPYFHIKRFRREAARVGAGEVFRRWSDDIERLAGGESAPGRTAARLLESKSLAESGLYRLINRPFEARFSRGMLETFNPFLLKRRYARNLVEKIRAADIVLCANGPLVADRFEFYLPSLLFESYLAKRMGKKVITVNQTIDIRDERNAEMVSCVYRTLDFHLTREPNSRDALLKFGVDEDKVLASCDYAFAADLAIRDEDGHIEDEEEIPPGSVALVVRGDRKVDYPAWTKVVRHLQRDMNKTVFLVHTCRLQDGRIEKELEADPPVRTLSGFYDFTVLTRLLKKFDWVIADRYHAIIFSIRASTPVIPLNPAFPTLKTEGLFRLFEYPIPVLPPLDDDHVDELVRAAATVDDRKEELRASLSRVDAELRKKCVTDLGIIEKMLRE